MHFCKFTPLGDDASAHYSPWTSGRNSSNTPIISSESHAWHSSCTKGLDSTIDASTLYRTRESERRSSIWLQIYIQRPALLRAPGSSLSSRASPRPLSFTLLSDASDGRKSRQSVAYKVFISRSISYMLRSKRVQLPKSILLTSSSSSKLGRVGEQVVDEHTRGQTPQNTYTNMHRLAPHSVLLILASHLPSYCSLHTCDPLKIPPRRHEGHGTEYSIDKRSKWARRKYTYPCTCHSTKACHSLTKTRNDQ
jgi:hypothetical protein